MLENVVGCRRPMRKRDRCNHPIGHDEEARKGRSDPARAVDRADQRKRHGERDRYRRTKLPTRSLIGGVHEAEAP